MENRGWSIDHRYRGYRIEERGLRIEESGEMI